MKNLRKNKPELEEVIFIFSNNKKLTIKGEKLDEFFQKIEKLCKVSGSENFWDFIREGDDEKK